MRRTSSPSECDSNYPTYSTCPFLDSRASDHTHVPSIPSTPSTPPTQRGRSKSQINATINIPPSWGGQQVRAAASPYTCIHVYSTRQVCMYISIHAHPNPLLDLLTSDQTVLEEALQSTYVCTYCIYIDVHQICGHCHRHMPLSGSHRARASELDVAGDLQGINPTQCHAPS